MAIEVGALLILLISFILAVGAVNTELSVPVDVRKLKIPKIRKKVSGVILFLKKKIVHYSSSS